MRKLIDEYGIDLMPIIMKLCENKALHLGGDETFFDTAQFLILMELTSGFIFTEALVKDRTESTWKKHTDKFFIFFKNIASFISDGGKVLVNLGKSIGNNGMDLFHILQDMRRLFATKFNSKRRALIAQLNKLKKNTQIAQEDKLAHESAIEKKLKVLDWGQKTYREGLFAISILVHPFKNICEINSSNDLQVHLNEYVIILESVKMACEINDKDGLIARIKNRVDPLSTLNDLWHSWVIASLESKTDDEVTREWANNVLLPYYYWLWQLKKSKRKKRLRLYYQQVVAIACERLHAHPLTQEKLTRYWINWAQAMARKYQRTTSAIEGRNARLSHYYFSTRGVKSSHVNSLTVLHNFWITRDDGTSAAKRLCGLDPPDLFEWLLERMKTIPLPRRRMQINDSVYSESLVA